MSGLELRLQSPEPRTTLDWDELRMDASGIFTPHTPIDEGEMFAGRIDLIEGLLDVIFQEGQHAVMFGERGVGKSSLVSIIKDKLLSKIVTFDVIKRNCTTEHDFKLIWKHVFADYEFDGVPASKWLDDNCNPFDIYRLVEQLSERKRPIIIIDEFDRVTDPMTKTLMADTIKYLADYKAKATVVIVGVSSTVSGLFAGHASITRNIRPILVPFMSPPELKQIVEGRLPLLSMKAEKGVVDHLVALSQGLPGYTHMMGQAAARSAIARRSLIISEGDLDAAIQSAVDSSLESVREAYAKAIRSTKPGNQYRQALLACALAETDDRGLFQRAHVRDRFSSLMGRRMEIPAFARHLNEFCKPDRGPALVKEGRAQSFEYRFAEPLVRPYALIKGVADGWVRKDGTVVNGAASA